MLHHLGQTHREVTVAMLYNAYDALQQRWCSATCFISADVQTCMLHVSVVVPPWSAMRYIHGNPSSLTQPYAQVHVENG